MENAPSVQLSPPHRSPLVQYICVDIDELSWPRKFELQMSWFRLRIGPINFPSNVELLHQFSGSGKALAVAVYLDGLLKGGFLPVGPELGKTPVRMVQNEARDGEQP